MSQLDLFASDKKHEKANQGATAVPANRPPTDAEFRRSQGYEKHIKSAQWENTRQDMFRLRGKKCEVCGATTNLELHHLTYERFGHESPHDLQILCKRHHEEADRAREADQQREFEERCEITRDENARHTYFTKKYGEGYVADEFMHRDFDEWLERKRENEYWSGGYPNY